ncbi:lipid IV(A) 3-deoxy-D-manno-octulosonic acid transferase [Alteromonas sp. a30]|uniref:lipid IV(A) 3-deoxy-D-manno-octulosonic acid transferase n=1 Tax=Alteromonas sp. a30 TaxID=2730917 RepID=UPI00227DE1C7|nr:lipid IV(A) 3-deoxy-D-manno-octulosonic acid transferase [Alteromonas sp. a30]MCY7295749.1 3-deoxy-D-manno-octulosonic acid transferase [Alteromonas sp. a30]
MPDKQNPSRYTPYAFSPSFAQELARWAYSLVTFLLLPVLLMVLAYKLLTGKNSFGAKVVQRYGFLPHLTHKNGVLIHCVSVGEVVAAAPLIKQIQTQHPELHFTVTTTTATGKAQAIQLLGDSVTHLYLPYDTPIAMANLLKKVQPQKILVTEVELWPNLIHLAWKKHIPVHIINARMTTRSCRSYKKISALFTPMLHKLSGICAQGQVDYHNYRQLGADASQVQLTNNIKFDQSLSEQDKLNIEEFGHLFDTNNRNVIIGGSTHEPEESTLINAYQELKRSHSNLLLILVPRHPQRFDKVAQLLQKSGLNYIKLSDASAAKQFSADTDVIFADKMGVLKPLYAKANIAFVGGSLAEKGGHNALEPAMLGLPIVMGPHIYNNPAICHALKEAGALHLVSDSEALTQQLHFWLDNTELAKTAGLAGSQVIEQNSGAILRTYTAIFSA